MNIYHLSQLFERISTLFCFYIIGQNLDTGHKVNLGNVSFLKIIHLAKKHMYVSQTQEESDKADSILSWLLKNGHDFLRQTQTLQVKD